MNITPETEAILKCATPNVPPHGLNEADYPNMLDYLVAILDRREQQLSIANNELVLLRGANDDMAIRYSELLRRARETHQACRAIPTRPSLWKRILRTVRK